MGGTPESGDMGGGFTNCVDGSYCRVLLMMETEG